MTTHKEDKNLNYKTIEEVFQVKYFIDFYQRDYTWAWENVTALLEDLYYRFEMRYSDSKEATVDQITKNYKWYYLNTYIINKQGKKTCIVDGQQRFSTLTLILIRLYHLAKTKELKDIRIDSLKDLILKSSSKGNEYWMGGDDRSLTLEDLFKNQRNTDPKRKLNRSEENLYNRYTWVSEYLEEKFNENTPHFLDCFILYFQTMIKLVEIEIEESDDVAMVFEVINAKGQKLKSHEILKAQLLSQIPKDELSEYLDYWNTACNSLMYSGLTFPNIEDPIDAFFTYFFRSRYTNSITELLTFKDYHKTIFSREWQKRLPLKQEKFVKEFIKTDFIYYSELMSKLLKSTLETNKYAFYNAKLNEISNQYVLILSVVKPNDEQKVEKEKLVAKLVDRHYSLLRLYGLYESNSFSKQLMTLVLKIRGKDNLEEIKTDFDDQLLNDINNEKNSTLTTLFNYNFFKNTKLANNNKRFVRYLLARIEDFLCQEMNNPAFGGYESLVNGKKYHIEHILAQNDSNKQMFGNNDDFFEEQRNRLGGLLLLKKGDNEMSNDEVYPNKLKTYANDTQFARTLTQNFYHKNSGFTQFKENYPEVILNHLAKFDESSLEERQKLVFELASILWGDKYLEKN